MEGGVMRGTAEAAGKLESHSKGKESVDRTFDRG